MTTTEQKTTAENTAATNTEQKTEKEVKEKTEEECLLKRKREEPTYGAEYAEYSYAEFPEYQDNYYPTQYDIPSYDTIIPAYQEKHDKVFSCPLFKCSKKYKNSNGLKYHLKHGHINPNAPEDLAKPYDCVNCERKYKNLNGLKYHLIHNHADLDCAKILADAKEKVDVMSRNGTLDSRRSGFSNPELLELPVETENPEFSELNLFGGESNGAMNAWY